MAIETNIGGDGSLFVGEDKIFRCEVLDASEIPVNVTGMVFRFVVRKKDGSADPAIFDKTASVVGTYNATRAVNTQRLEAQLTDTELNTVKKSTYRYSWKRMDDGSETVVAYGDFTPQLATAR